MIVSTSKHLKKQEKAQMIKRMEGWARYVKIFI